MAQSRFRQALALGSVTPDHDARLHMGGGGSPPAPDYVGAANAQGAANVDTARVQGKISNPNYVTPLGTQTVDWGQKPDQRVFDQAGYDSALKTYNAQLATPTGNAYSFDASGNPLDNNGQRINTSGGTMAAPNMDSYYRTIPGGTGDQPTITQSLTPAGQSRFDQEQRIIGQVGNVAEQGLGRVQDAYSKPFDFKSASDARQQTQDALFSRLEPQMARDQEALRTRLVNQGLRGGSTGYDAEMGRFDRGKTDARMQVIAQGGQEQDRAVQLASFLRNQPLNEMNALRTGSQVTMPQFAGYSGSNVSPPPLFNATAAQGQGALNAFNANQANSNADNQALMSAASMAAMYAFASDRRLKSNVVRVGTHPLGIGIYEYDIFGRRERGVMADEVAKVKPDAVLRHSGGYDMVNYGAL